MRSAPEPLANLHARAYSRSWRLVAGTLVAVSRISLIAVCVGLLTASEPVTLLALVWALVLLSALPALAGWLIARACAVHLHVGDGQLVLERAGLRIDIPCAAIDRVVPWLVPLPGPGFSFLMRSARRLSYGVQASDPMSILLALADAGGIDRRRLDAQHPVLMYAQARRRGVHRRWYQPLCQFGLFAFVPTGVWFYAHQHIAYGGLLGQYYLEGRIPYLKTLTITWGLSTVYLILYASAWRGAAEGGALLAAWLVPSRAASARRVVEIVYQVAYYGGVPVLVTWPFLT